MKVTSLYNAMNMAVRPYKDLEWSNAMETPLMRLKNTLTQFRNVQKDDEQTPTLQKIEVAERENERERERERALSV